MWKKIKKALRRKHLCFRFQIVDYGYGVASSVKSGGHIIRVLHRLQDKYDFDITDVYLAQDHMSRIAIKCDKSDGTDIFADFVSDCGMEMKDCYISRWK